MNLLSFYLSFPLSRPDSVLLLLELKTLPLGLPSFSPCILVIHGHDCFSETTPGKDVLRSPQFKPWLQHLLLEHLRQVIHWPGPLFSHVEHGDDHCTSQACVIQRGHVRKMLPKHRQAWSPFVILRVLKEGTGCHACL